MKYLSLFLFVLILIGCKDKDENPRPYDLYAVGFNQPEAKSVAIWKNFEELPVNDDGEQILVNGIVVDGEDVYIYGLQFVPGRPYMATYWKNGTRVQLSTGEIKGMTISGGDVYAAGVETDVDGQWHAAYWKNGEVTRLPHTVHSSAEGIVVVGNDVHIIGSEDGPDTVRARYWKNDEHVSLLPKVLISDFTSITSSGSDIYIAGYQFNDFGSNEIKASYWKNGSEVVLGNGSTAGIAVSGSDVYVAGDQLGPVLSTGYWLNQNFHLTMEVNQTYRPTAKDIIVAPNGDVILWAWKLEPTGSRTGGSILWINDEPQAPFRGNNTQFELMGIAIKK